MRDRLLKTICDLENWLNGPGSKWYFIPVRVAGYIVIFAAMIVTNLLAIFSIPISALMTPRVLPTVQNSPYHPIAVTDDDFQEMMERYSGEALILADFWAPWCGPCLLMKPALQQFAKQQKGSVVVLLVNISSASNTAKEFEVSLLPTQILFRDSKELARNAGALDYKTLSSFVDGAIKQQPDSAQPQQ